MKQRIVIMCALFFVMSAASIYASAQDNPTATEDASVPTSGREAACYTTAHGDFDELREKIRLIAQRNSNLPPVSLARARAGAHIILSPFPSTERSWSSSQPLTSSCERASLWTSDGSLSTQSEEEHTCSGEWEKSTPSYDREAAEDFMTLLRGDGAATNSGEDLKEKLLSCLMATPVYFDESPLLSYLEGKEVRDYRMLLRARYWITDVDLLSLTFCQPSYYSRKNACAALLTSLQAGHTFERSVDLLLLSKFPTSDHALLNETVRLLPLSVRLRAVCLPHVPSLKLEMLKWAQGLDEAYALAAFFFLTEYPEPDICAYVMRMERPLRAPYLTSLAQNSFMTLTIECFKKILTLEECSMEELTALRWPVDRGTIFETKEALLPSLLTRLLRAVTFPQAKSNP
ncbi:MAG: hypothetical protein LCH26_07550 [Proteobacteria bacterium]|nr:hypothetical protein [Pseudomonadota bacterium]